MLEHPEHYCDECGDPNVSWSVAPEHWTEAMGAPAGSGEGPNPVLCPVCFVRRWERVTGLTASWDMEPNPRTVRPHDRRDEPEPEADYYGDNMQRLADVLAFARLRAQREQGETGSYILQCIARIESKNPTRRRTRDGRRRPKANGPRADEGA